MLTDQKHLEWRPDAPPVNLVRWLQNFTTTQITFPATIFKTMRKSKTNQKGSKNYLQSRRVRRIVSFEPPPSGGGLGRWRWRWVRLDQGFKTPQASPANMAGKAKTQNSRVSMPPTGFRVKMLRPPVMIATNPVGDGRGGRGEGNGTGG